MDKTVNLSAERIKAKIEETTAEERQVLSEMHRLYHLQLYSLKD